MFTTPCFIRKNTPELRKKLEKLGFKRNSPDYTLNDSITFAYQYSAEPGFDTPHYVVANSFDIPFDKESTLRGKFIDCGTNEELFLAIAALRDDSDYMQFFTDGKTWFKCEYEDIEQKREEAKACNYFGAWVFNCHKASVEELIKHFNHG